MHWNIRMFLKLILLLITLQVSRCSVVIDSFSQKGLYISDYCPHMEYCPEGAHVMCMFYNPDQEMGPKCSNPQNVTMTAGTANQLLDITNAIRSKIANGRETGKNGTRLPRGFGIFRLKWDNELATLAQVLANQCVLEHDLCRATKKFPDPGQAAGLVRFTYPAWIPVNRADIQSQLPGLDDSKIAYAATQTMKSWYMQKASVTEDMIMRFPLVPINNLYVKVIHGSATHMGCGISAYTELALYKAKESMTYNSILIICNFSSRPRPGELTYSVLPTRGSSTCGCPEGSQEDSDCLCNEAPPQTPRVAPDGLEQSEPESCQTVEQNCEPKVVLLPIFTVEDAPPDKLMEQVEDIREPLTGYIADRLSNGTVHETSKFELNDLFANTSPQRSFQSRTMQKPGPRHYQAIPHSLSPVYQIKSALSPQTNQASHIARSESIIRKSSSPRRSYLYSPSDGGQRRISQSPRQPAGHKSSIFSRVAKFKLPNGGNNFAQYESVKPDVKPRKDFKNIQRIVNNYIQQRNNKFRRTEVVANKHQDNLNKMTPSTTPKPEEITETILSNVEESIINFDNFHQKGNSTIEDNIKHFDLNYEESDNKLMTLLDTLEREVKHVELDGNEKEIFDAKIRKIYDTVVRKPTTTYPPIPISNSLSKSHIKSLPMLANLYDNEFGESKPYMKHDSNHVTDDDHRVRHEPDHLSEESRNGYKPGLEKIVNRGRDYEYFDNKVGDKGRPIHNDDKNNHYDNDMLTDSDHKLFADIESKYNERLIETLSARRFNDGVDKFDSKYDSTIGHKYPDAPVSRNRHNNVKYENYKPRATSSEVRGHRGFENYRDKESSVKDPIHHDIITRKMYRNSEDDRKVSAVNRNGKANPYANEFDQNDPLSVERRKYYQEKLENLERRLHDRSFRRKNYEDRPNERPFRRMRPNMEQPDRQKPKTQGDGFYLPERARFLHGF